nr:hypothetical protein [Tanacetum cinerariifolium]
MGYEKPPAKLTFYKAFFFAQLKFLIHTIVQCISTKRTAWNGFSSSMASAVLCIATGFSGVETPLFDSMLVQLQQLVEAGVELKKRVKRVERKKKSKTSGLKRLRRVGADQRVESSFDTVLGVEEDASKQGEKIASNDADEGTTLVDVETDEEEVTLDAESQERTNLKTKVHLVKENVDAANVTMTMAQTLIKLKAEKARILDEKIAQKLHDEESVVAKQVKERQSNSIKRYQTLKKKPVSVAQARKNMMIYLKNMAGYKMEFFKGMTYDEIRPIFEREYNKIQTLFKQDKDVQKIKKKRVTDETLLQESFKKLRAAEVSGSESTQEIPTDNPKEITEEKVQNMLEIVPVLEFRVEALQGWSLAEPIGDKERSLWVELKRLFKSDANDVPWKLQRYMHAPLTWRLYSDCGVHHVSSTRGHDIYMLTAKYYPLSNAVMILMVSGKLQVEEDNKMARYLVMKIFMEANRSRNISV